jgi:hypothetical protein
VAPVAALTCLDVARIEREAGLGLCWLVLEEVSFSLPQPPSSYCVYDVLLRQTHLLSHTSV